MTSVIWTQRYDVNTLVVNAEKRLGLVGLLMILQDVAWIHGGHLGHGFDAMMAKALIWVMARQKLAMRDWPKWGDTIDLRTRVRPVEGLMVLRDTEIWSAGSKVGECVAGWLVLDAVTRRPSRTAMRKGAILTRDDGGLDLTPARIAPADDLAPLARFRVQTSDLDANGHVNNVRYAQWILDAAPSAAHQTHVVGDYEVNFLAETSDGDEVIIEWDGARSSPRFQGRREGDGRIVFVARLQVLPAKAAGEV